MIRETNKENYKIISIGSSCFISTEMRIIGQRYESMPFDFIESNLYFINEVIINPDESFDSVYGRWSRNENLKIYKEGGGFTQCSLFHYDPTSMEDIEHFKRAMERFKSALVDENIKILFMHINTPYFDKYKSDVPKIQIELLREIKNSLLLYYPSLKFDILSINPYVVDTYLHAHEEYIPYKIYHEESNLIIIQPWCTVPLTIHWGTERDVWNKIWKQIFEKFNIEYIIPT